MITEKIVRLFLSSSQLFFPEFILSIYSLKGAYEDLAVDLYVILKVSFPLLILMNHWQNNPFVLELWYM
jgi:hypothetical protein